ncbi:MAG: GNAT family N-acetyltransferase [Acidimicrobiia bacterium]|nr:GNAT family N-acetyltransferase [Acidimicrobiia bacterium]
MEGVRPATDDDLGRLAELARAAIAELTPMKGGTVWAAREARPEPIEGSLRASLADDDTRVVVGTIDGFPIGYAVARVEVLNDGSRLGVVDDIFVEPDAREVGVGEAMMSDLVSWCEERGCTGMDAMALPGHRSAKNFFEESGFTARKLVMHHRLEDR